MLKLYLNRINRKISELHFIFHLNVVSVDQITFCDEFHHIGKIIVKTPK